MRPSGDEGEWLGVNDSSEAFRIEELRRLVSNAGEVDGVGIDIEAISRFRQPAMRLFRPTEIDFCSSQQDPAEAFAGRWCAKEAVVKAISGRRVLSIRDVEILSISHAADVAIAIAIAATPRSGRPPEVTSG